MKKLILIAVMMLAGFQDSKAEMLQGQTGWFSAGDTLNFSLPYPKFVERVLISAEGWSSFTMAQVYADGEFVSNMGVPGRDPEYPVVIRKKVSNISVKFQGSVNIRDFKVFTKDQSQHSESVEVMGSDSVTELASKASQVVDFLQARFNQDQFNKYLKPIRKAALLLEASSMGRNSTSEFTQKKAIELIASIQRAEKMIDGLMDSPYYNRSALSLLTIKESLERKYDLRVEVIVRP